MARPKKNPLLRGWRPAIVSANIAREVRRGVDKARAVAAALRLARASWRVKHPMGPFPGHLQGKSQTANPSKRDAIAEAVRRFTGFRGAQPTSVKRVAFPALPQAVLTVGKCFMVGYVTVRDGERASYVHKFRASARPLLVVTSDGRQLYLLGGAYSVTDRGIEDAPEKGR